MGLDKSVLRPKYAQFWSVAANCASLKPLFGRLGLSKALSKFILRPEVLLSRIRPSWLILAQPKDFLDQAKPIKPRLDRSMRKLESANDNYELEKLSKSSY